MLYSLFESLVQMHCSPAVAFQHVTENHHHHYVHVASEGRCVTAVSWPRRMADLHALYKFLTFWLRSLRNKLFIPINWSGIAVAGIFRFLALVFELMALVTSLACCICNQVTSTLHLVTLLLFLDS